jgi:hypothetical protein
MWCSPASRLALTWKSRADPTGAFAFTSIPPGRFTLAITAQGFKRYQKNYITLAALEKLSLGIPSSSGRGAFDTVRRNNGFYDPFVQHGFPSLSLQAAERSGREPFPGA